MLKLLLPIALLALSQTDDGPLDMPAMVKRSEVIIVAEPIDANSDVERIDITPAGKKPDAVKYPPFNRHRLHFNVIRVLKGPATLVNKPLTVDAHAHAALYEAHRSTWLKGKPREVKLISYQSTLDAEARTQAPQLVVFLVMHGKDPELAAVNAYESVALEETIKAAIAAK